MRDQGKRPKGHKHLSNMKWKETEKEVREVRISSYFQFPGDVGRVSVAEKSNRMRSGKRAGDW